jgi:hypothetical protein
LRIVWSKAPTKTLLISQSWYVSLIFHAEFYYWATREDSERCFGCEIRRHEELKGCHPWLDHPSRTAIESSIGAQQQNRSRVSSRADWSFIMSCWSGLVEYWVCVVVLLWIRMHSDVS